MRKAANYMGVSFKVLLATLCYKFLAAPSFMCFF